MFLKLYEKLYAPLTAGILQPFTADQRIPTEKIGSSDILVGEIMVASLEWVRT